MLDYTSWKSWEVVGILGFNRKETRPATWPADTVGNGDIGYRARKQGSRKTGNHCSWFTVWPRLPLSCSSAWLPIIHPSKMQWQVRWRWLRGCGWLSAQWQKSNGCLGTKEQQLWHWRGQKWRLELEARRKCFSTNFGAPSAPPTKMYEMEAT
jgi:hypothetical protein